MLLITDKGHALCLNYHPGFRAVIRQVNRVENNKYLYLNRDAGPYRSAQEFELKKIVPVSEYINFLHRNIKHKYSMFNWNRQKTIVHVNIYSNKDLLLKSAQ